MIAKMSSASRCSASEARQASPSGITWPAGSRVRGVDQVVLAGHDRGEVRRDPRRGREVPEGGAAVRAGSGSGVGWFDSTVQCAGAVTWKVNAALRSGCSKFAYALRASAGSKFVYMYTLPSAESTVRCRPAPVLV